MQTAFMVILPNLKLGIDSNALLTFALSWEEVAAISVVSLDYAVGAGGAIGIAALGGQTCS